MFHIIAPGLINADTISTVKPINAIATGTPDADVNASPPVAINKQVHEFTVITFGIIFFSV